MEIINTKRPAPPAATPAPAAAAPAAAPAAAAPAAAPTAAPAKKKAAEKRGRKWRRRDPPPPDPFPDAIKLTEEEAQRYWEDYVKLGRERHKAFLRARRQQLREYEERRWDINPRYRFAYMGEDGPVYYRDPPPPDPFAAHKKSRSRRTLHPVLRIFAAYMKAHKRTGTKAEVRRWWAAKGKRWPA